MRRGGDKNKEKAQFTDQQCKPFSRAIIES